jgi:isopentenyl-diphosphate delta-isomerase
MKEHVVLINEQNQVLGTALKATIHTAQTPLHRAFSSFIFNSKGELLLQRRALSKVTWPGVWANTCCGHPSLTEGPLDTAKRRLKYELGLDFKDLILLSDYRYKFIKDGVMENEICPIIIGFTDQIPTINPDEVDSINYIQWDWFVEGLDNNAPAFAPWTVEEARIIAGNEFFKKLLNQYVTNKKINF